MEMQLVVDARMKAGHLALQNRRALNLTENSVLPQPVIAPSCPLKKCIAFRALPFIAAVIWRNIRVFVSPTECNRHTISTMHSGTLRARTWRLDSAPNKTDVQVLHELPWAIASKPKSRTVSRQKQGSNNRRQGGKGNHNKAHNRVTFWRLRWHCRSFGDAQLLSASARRAEGENI